MFVFLAAVKCHAFGVVAYADKGITVVAVELFVFIVVTNQRVAYPHGDKGCQNHKHIDKPNDAVRNIEAEHGQDARQTPQNNGKFQRGNDRIDHAAHKFYGRGNEILRVLLDTLVDVVRCMVAHLQAVVVFVGKPARSQNFIEPLRPFNRQALIEKVVDNVVKRPHQHHARVHRCKHPKRGGVQILHRVVKPFGHKGTQYIQPHFGQQQRNHRRNQQQYFDRAFWRQAQPQDIGKLTPEARFACQKQNHRRGGGDHQQGL